VLVFLSLTEIVLAPIWVWLAYGEKASPMTLAGGAIVLGAIAYEGVRRAQSRVA
jgi:drug/metabolite transporter (DMT)-like permease